MRVVVVGCLRTMSTPQERWFRGSDVRDFFSCLVQKKPPCFSSTLTPFAQQPFPAHTAHRHCPSHRLVDRWRMLRWASGGGTLVLARPAACHTQCCIVNRPCPSYQAAPSAGPSADLACASASIEQATDPIARSTRGRSPSSNSLCASLAASSATPMLGSTLTAAVAPRARGGLDASRCAPTPASATLRNAQ